MSQAAPRPRSSRALWALRLQFFAEQYQAIIGVALGALILAPFVLLLWPVGPVEREVGQIIGFSNLVREEGNFPRALVQVRGAVVSVALLRPNSCHAGQRIWVSRMRRLVGSTNSVGPMPCR